MQQDLPHYARWPAVRWVLQGKEAAIRLEKVSSADDNKLNCDYHECLAGV